MYEAYYELEPKKLGLKIWLYNLIYLNKILHQKKEKKKRICYKK